MQILPLKSRASVDKKTPGFAINEKGLEGWNSRLK